MRGRPPLSPYERSDQQRTRATTGRKPNGEDGPKVDSSRFLTDADLVNTVQKAELLRNPNAMQNPRTVHDVDVTMPAPIGEGWAKRSGDYLGTTNNARVRFDDYDHVFTAFPIFK